MAWKKVLLEGDAAALSNNAPANVDHIAANAGAATDASRADHKHDLNEGAVGSIAAITGAAASLGSANAVPHLDHLHALGPLAAELDCNQKVLDGLVLELALTGPDSGNEVEAQLWYNNNAASQHAYIWIP
jgi:hypothetical protein